MIEIYDIGAATAAVLAVGGETITKYDGAWHPPHPEGASPLSPASPREATS